MSESQDLNSQPKDSATTEFLEEEEDEEEPTQSPDPEKADPEVQLNNIFLRIKEVAKSAELSIEEKSRICGQLYDKAQEIVRTNSHLGSIAKDLVATLGGSIAREEGKYP